MNNERSGRKLKVSIQRILVVGGLLVGLSASLLIAIQLSQTNDARVGDRFASSAEAIVGAVENQIETQLTLLRGTAGFFAAADGITADQFGAYIDRLDLERNYSGVLGIGFAVTRSERAALERLASQLDPDRRVQVEAWPEGERDVYSTILFLEPRNERNMEAIGFDMMSEETRRTAMEEAARTGRTTVSGKVQLVQEIDPEKQPGFLVYSALYRDTGGSGRGEHYGWVYSPLRAYDLFDSLFPQDERADVSISIYDGAPAQDNLLYRSAAAPEAAINRTVQRINVGGRQWYIEVVALPGFASGINSALPGIVGLVGGLITVTLALLLFQQVRAAERVDRQVKSRTAELQAANTRLRDEVTAREKAESTVRQMQRVESVGQLTGGIAHDFNNMLAIVVGNLEMAKRRLQNPEILSKFIDQAKLGAERAAALTQRLLAFSRQQPLSPSRVDPNALIVGMKELLTRTIGKQVDVRTDLAPDTWPTLADAGQLENAVLNLAINARDAMQHGDILTIATSNDVRAISDGSKAGVMDEFVAITVRDTGSGMSPEVQAKALDPFFTTKEVGKGTGLGLSQVFGFVRQSGGDLAIESAEGEGTAITIFLPRFVGEDRGEDAAERPDASRVDIPGGIAQEMILVVDDEEQVLAMTVELLRELGYSVIHAPGGQEALDKLAGNPGIRVVLSDIVMPGMNGYQLAERALEAVPDLKFVLVSGFDTISEKSAIVDEHGIAKLQKPFSRQDLALAIRAAFDAAKRFGDNGEAGEEGPAASDDPIDEA